LRQLHIGAQWHLHEVQHLWWNIGVQLIYGVPLRPWLIPESGTQQQRLSRFILGRRLIFQEEKS